MAPESAWKATLGELELQMTKATFNTWLRDAYLISGEKDVYTIGVRNDYAKDWLENRLCDTIVRTLSAIVGRGVELRFVVEGEGEAASPITQSARANGFEANGREPARQRTNGDHSGSASSGRNGRPANGRRPNGHRPGENPFRPHYVFATFVVGNSNRLAHAAALSAAEHPGQTYNPLFIYGGVGLGKTHLLHAIGQKCLADGLDVCYVSSETFTNDLVQSIRSQKMAEFRQRYRTPDVLLIDDIQFIAGKESTQEELFHTFNDLHSRGKQVVLSSDRPPKAMVTLEERLQSRFAWGLMADIQMPDMEMRKAIVQAKAESLDIFIPDSVVDIIVHRVRSNIRELEGSLNKVIAYAQLTGRTIDGQLAELALADLFHQREDVTLGRVLDVVSSHFGVSEDAICGTGRSRAIAFPRQMVMYLARTETDASFPQIGSELGNRDHTTVIYGHDKIAGLMETDATVRRTVLELKAALYEGQPA